MVLTCIKCGEKWQPSIIRNGIIKPSGLTTDNPDKKLCPKCTHSGGEPPLWIQMTRTYKYCVFCEIDGVSCMNYWWAKIGKKPTKIKYKGCKMSHGRCGVCGDTWDRIRNKNKRKSQQKELQKYLKFEIKGI